MDKYDVAQKLYGGGKTIKKLTPLLGHFEFTVLERTDGLWALSCEDGGSIDYIALNDIPRQHFERYEPIEGMENQFMHILYYESHNMAGETYTELIGVYLTEEDAETARDGFIQFKGNEDYSVDGWRIESVEYGKRPTNLHWL